MTSARLAQIMRAKHWTQKDVARIIGCHPKIVSYWMRNDRDGSPAPIAPLIAEWLEAVMAGEDRPPPAPEAWKRRLPAAAVGTTIRQADA